MLCIFDGNTSPLLMVLTHRVKINRKLFCVLFSLVPVSLCRSVGVSNFGVHHLEGLRKAGRPTPSVNQIELHTQMRRQDIVDYCRQHGIAVMGYSPLAKGQRMNDKKSAAVASKYDSFTALPVMLFIPVVSELV